jgi:hypothetical protein
MRLYDVARTILKLKITAGFRAHRECGIRTHVGKAIPGARAGRHMTPEGFEVGPYREVFKIAACLRTLCQCGIRTDRNKAISGAIRYGINRERGRERMGEGGGRASNGGPKASIRPY